MREIKNSSVDIKTDGKILLLQMGRMSILGNRRLSRQYLLQMIFILQKNIWRCEK